MYISGLINVISWLWCIYPARCPYLRDRINRIWPAWWQKQRLTSANVSVSRLYLRKSFNVIFWGKSSEVSMSEVERFLFCAPANLIRITQWQFNLKCFPDVNMIFHISKKIFFSFHSNHQTAPMIIENEISKLRIKFFIPFTNRKQRTRARMFCVWKGLECTGISTLHDNFSTLNEIS